LTFRSCLSWKHWTSASYYSNGCCWKTYCRLLSPLKYGCFYSNYLYVEFDLLHSYPVCKAILILKSSFMLSSFGFCRILEADILAIASNDIHLRVLIYALSVKCPFIIFNICYQVIFNWSLTVFSKNCSFLST
jgi:hypothetical protein